MANANNSFFNNLLRFNEERDINEQTSKRSRDELEEETDLVQLAKRPRLENAQAGKYIRVRSPGIVVLTRKCI